MSEVTPYLNTGIYVWLLYSFPSGERAVVGCHRDSGPGRPPGWHAPEEIDVFGRPHHGMWIEAWIKGWKRYCDYNPKKENDCADIQD